MCSTFCLGPGAHGFSFLQVRHFWKAPTSNAHQNFTLGYLLTPALRSVCSKCARKSAPVQGPTVSVLCNYGIFGKPHLLALTETLS